jgi:hypothetical protein
VRRGLLIVLATVLAASPAGCGGSGHSSAATAPSTPAATSPAPSPGNAALPRSTVVTLSSHVLTASDLRGFSQRGPLSEGTKAAGWVKESEPESPAAARTRHTARLRRLGFTAGVRERLESTGGGGAEGISMAEQFTSPSGARAELADQIAQLKAQAGFSSFAVPAIPGARGLATTPGGPVTGFNVAFAKGAYYYLVGVGFPAGTSPAPTREGLIAAAQRLYGRVHS